MAVVAGKTIVASYYQTAANTSYFIGCSDGGRQGLDTHLAVTVAHY